LTITRKQNPVAKFYCGIEITFLIFKFLNGSGSFLIKTSKLGHPVHGEIVVQISIGSFKLEAKVLVADIVDAFILGLDLMDELDVKIDFKNKLLRIGNEEIVFSAKETPMGRRDQIKLILDQDTDIPANSEIIVKAHLERETEL